MNLPRLYIDGEFRKILHPTRVSLTLSMKPLSSAELTMPQGEGIPIRSTVELFSPYGSAGFFRARTPEDGYGGETTVVQLEHMIAEAGDYLVKEKISKMMGAKSAVRTFWKYYKGSNWKLGSIADLDDGKVSVSVDYDNILNSIMLVLDQKQDCMLKYDFRKKPWTVSIVKKPTTVTAECRLSRNVEGAKIHYDDTEMANRVYYETYAKDKDGNLTPTWHYVENTASQKKYKGTIERTVSASSDLTADEAKLLANTFLKEHKDPRVGVTIQALLLSQITGESLDKFETGRMLRLTIPEDDICVEKNIHSISWADVYKDPLRATAQIGDEEDTLVSFIHNIDKTGRGSRGGGGGGGKPPGEKEPTDYYKQFDADVKKSDQKIEIYAKEVSRQKEILKQAGMDLNRDGVLVYAKSKATNLQAMIDVQSNRINLVVKGYGKDAHVDAAEIVAGINKRTGSFVRIKAKQVNLDGYVTMKTFTAEEGRVTKLMTGKTTATQLNATKFNTGTASIGECTIYSRLNFNGHWLSWFTVDGHHLLGY